MIKKFKAYWRGKNLKQRVCIVVAVLAVVTLIVFTIKVNFIDRLTSNDGEAASNAPSFHISFVDVGALLAAVGAYCVHKIREKKKQGRL